MSRLTLLILLLLPYAALAQFAQLEVSTADRSAFFIAIDDSLRSDRSSDKQLLSPVSIGKHSIWIINDPDFSSQKFELEFTEERRYIYELSTENEVMTLLPISVSEVDTVQKAVVQVKKPKPGAKKPIAEPVIGRRIAGITLDSLLLKSQLKSYTGKFGCHGAYGDQAFQRSLQQIKAEDFESKRTVIVKELINTNCISVNQLGKLLEFFEFDDAKLSLVEAVKGHVFDLGNLGKLEDKFTFSTSKTRFRELISAY